ncbi:ferrochelatase [Actinomyces bowdenii]|uniref:ferrochelatase n=1 Tax=Actinomyces bowdenii TaxID=131109 RepID=UPI00214B644C|nr:ferrochelatase [Actinomyces bowdenii]MCR2051291.1 ferrochelatase [Actinomyces bowdenii]
MDLLAPYDAVLLLSYGGPTGPDDVLPFMRNATAGRGVPDSRLLEVSGHYQRFGGASPINERNAELLEALRAELARRGSSVPVVIGNRNWHPFVSQALRELADAGARRVLALTTAAYGSYSGCRQYREDVTVALGQLESGTDGATGQGPEADAAARVGGRGGRPLGAQAPVVDKARPYYNTPGMLEANTEAIAAAYRRLAGQGVAAQDIRLVFVTHSIPVSMEKGSAPRPGQEAGPEDPGVLDPGVSPDLSTEISYVAQHEALIEVLVPQVVQRLGLARAPECDLVYCSRSGPPQARWLEPDINDHLEALAAQGPAGRAPAVVVAPIGFVSDHMEVVFDLDTEARETAEALGMPYARAATAGTHPAFVASLVDVLAERAAAARGEPVHPGTTTGLGPFHTVCPPGCCRPATHPAHPGPGHGG